MVIPTSRIQNFQFKLKYTDKSLVLAKKKKRIGCFNCVHIEGACWPESIPIVPGSTSLQDFLCKLGATFTRTSGGYCSYYIKGAISPLFEGSLYCLQVVAFGHGCLAYFAHTAECARKSPFSTEAPKVFSG